jgi:hypothetical protein
MCSQSFEVASSRKRRALWLSRVGVGVGAREIEIGIQHRTFALVERPERHTRHDSSILF